MRHALLLTSLVVMGIGTGAAVPSGEEVVEIRVRGHYFTEPATVLLTVVVEPAAHHRALVIEADGDHYFRSSAVPLEGEDEKRMHTMQFTSLPAGNYVLRARVLAGREVVASDVETLVVTGVGAPR